MIVILTMVSIIGIFAAVMSFQYADAISNDKSAQCVADSSYASKCLQKDNTAFPSSFSLTNLGATEEGLSLWIGKMAKY